MALELVIHNIIHYTSDIKNWENCSNKPYTKSCYVGLNFYSDHIYLFI